MKHALKVNKWLAGAAPSQISLPIFFFPFLTTERQTKAHMMSRGPAFGKSIAAQHTTGLFTDIVFAFAGGGMCRVRQCKRGHREGGRFSHLLQMVPLSGTKS